MIRQASNEALIQLIVDSITNELSSKPHRIQLIMNFLTRELPKSESDFSILRVSEHLTKVMVIFEENAKRVAEYLVNRYNVAAGVSADDEAGESQSKALMRALEKFENSVFTIGLPHKFSSQHDAKNDAKNDAYFKALSLSALMQSTLIEQEKQTAMTNLSASEFFDKLIKNYSPLLADAHDEQATKAKGDSETQNLTKEEKKTATRKGIKTLVMGQLKDVSSIKLSDFIDERFLEELDDIDEVMHETKFKQPVASLISDLLSKSPFELLSMPSVSKRIKMEKGYI